MMVNIRDSISLMPPRAALVILALAAHMGTDNTAFPSYDLMMAETGLARGTLSDALKWLRENGWIRSYRRGSGNRYVVNSKYFTFCDADTSSIFELMAGNRNQVQSSVQNVDERVQGLNSDSSDTGLQEVQIVDSKKIPSGENPSGENPLIEGGSEGSQATPPALECCGLLLVSTCEVDVVLREMHELFHDRHGLCPDLTSIMDSQNRSQMDSPVNRDLLTCILSTYRPDTVTNTYSYYLDLEGLSYRREVWSTERFLSEFAEHWKSRSDIRAAASAKEV